MLPLTPDLVQFPCGKLNKNLIDLQINKSIDLDIQLPDLINLIIRHLGQLLLLLGSLLLMI